MNIERIKELEDRIQKSEGWIAHTRIKNFSLSHKVFNINYKEFKEFLQQFSDPLTAPEIWRVDRRNLLEQILDEAIRLLHNYLAAAKSLVDHTRVFVNEYYTNCDFYTQYNNKIKEIFAESPLSHFVQDLRNYVLHKELPFTSATLHYGPDTGISNTLFLDISTLREWNRWTSFSERYIANLKDKTDFRSFIDEYWVLVNGFYLWFNNSLNELHKEKFSETAILQNELKILYEKSGLKKFYE